MFRYSSAAKLVHDEIIYNSNLEQALSLLSEIDNPRDMAFIKCIILNFKLVFQYESFLEELKALENYNLELNDPFVNYYIQGLYTRFYGGMGPIINKEKAIKHFEIATKIIQNWCGNNEWEKNVTLGHYYYTKSVYEMNVHNNYSEAPLIQKKGITALLNVPQDGKIYASFSIVKLGDYYRNLGNFDEAVKQYFRAFEIYQEYETPWERYPIQNLIWLYYTKGNLVEAKNYNKQLFAIGKKFNNNSIKFTSTMFSGHIFQREGNYDQALLEYYNCIEYAQLMKADEDLCIGYFEIFKLLYFRYKLTLDKKYLWEATAVSNKIEELRKNNPKNMFIEQDAKKAQALILSNGNLREKAKAIDLLEICVKNLPQDITMALQLVNLLFEDVVLSNDVRSIDQIERLMERISVIPLHNNPQMVYFYTSQQIMQAKYQYYIKGDIGKGLDILDNAKSHIATFGLEILVLEIENEIEILEKEAKRWGEIEISVKERIQDSQFNKYVEKALEMANIQK